MDPRKLPDFYQYAIHLIYAVIIGQSYALASVVFVPIENISHFDGFQSGFALFLAYVIVITGWVGWTKSITRNPHSENALGNFRFVADLFILFWYYYLINLANPDKNSSYGETFIWVLPVIFASYTIWDVLKYYEYRGEIPEELKHRKKRLLYTVYFTIIFICLGILYYEGPQLHFTILLEGKDGWNIVFMFITFLLTLSYRSLKWVVPTARRYRKRKNTGSVSSG